MVPSIDKKRETNRSLKYFLAPVEDLLTVFDGLDLFLDDFLTVLTVENRQNRQFSPHCFKAVQV